MNRKSTRLLLAAVLAVALLVALPLAASSAEQGNRKIVVFKSGRVDEKAVARIERLGGTAGKRLPLIGAVAVRLPDVAAERAVGRMAEVLRVEDDIVVQATVKPEKAAKPTPTQPSQTLPWGIVRIEADDAVATAIADPVKVAVVDTGIDTAHPDLAANIKGGYSAVSYTAKYTDDNGHGTHVAGTVAAANNTIGVIGVAHSADLYAVKVLNRKGSGYVSDIIEGIQWSVANDMDVINMSLGASTYSYSFDEACKQAYAAGVVVVAAAGNEYPGADTVQYPARFAEVIAVSATTSSDGLAYFSSTGPSVELAAPGYQIYSTYKKSSYSTLSGTSMASPHVAGVAALVLAKHPTWTPAEVRARLHECVDDLGASGLDTSFGYGLVRADLALAQ